MSCGNPHETPCADVLDRLYEYIDGELGGERGHEVKHHLEECAPCLKEFGLEEAVKAVVKRSCSDPAPPELRAKVLVRIATVRATLRSEVER